MDHEAEGLNFRLVKDLLPFPVVIEAGRKGTETRPIKLVSASVRIRTLDPCFHLGLTVPPSQQQFPKCISGACDGGTLRQRASVGK